MFEVTVSDHIMIAHSLPDPFFGPAQQLHGATYEVIVSFRTPHLNEFQVVLDIGYALTILKEVLSELNFRNLDEIPRFKGKLTTTEFLAQQIYRDIGQKISSIFQGQLCVQLKETPVASASFTGPVPLA